ncbi:arginine biosynthesis bifunctional protein ArgJ, chloroplastic isoform X5 [Hevea brasiliensis]|uniref:arginine biosynthesis bifunctional protein ArgJ, chloroplastic isoform X5 n=1 Tax=Hevea brasiliensis TaxID=3981 RepID=UPI0025E06C2F|nr:arginine biosynthesis bifunctional protein ArgJ, chloroplastic isoform X5 [Hevea brasiliensis]
MNSCAPYYVSIKIPELHTSKILSSFSLSKRDFKVFAVASGVNEGFNYIPAAPIFIPEGPWKEIPGGVTAAKGFKAAGMYGGLRAKGEKPDLALVTCDVDATAAGVFTTNMVAAAPVLYCKKALDESKMARAVLINAGQANAATGDAGYQDVLECADTLAMILKLKREEVLIESTGVIGQRIRKQALLNALPKLVSSATPSTEGALSAAVAITTTDLVSKSVAIESQVITTDALVKSDVWRKMVQFAVNRSFNQITVDGDTSTNDTVIALASGLSGSTSISSINCDEAVLLQACLDAVMQGLAKSIAWDGEGATCLIEVSVTGAESEMKAVKIARSVASSSLVKAAVYGRNPNWGDIAAAAGYAGVPFHQNNLRIMLGDILLMHNGQPLAFDRAAASNYLRKAGETHGTVRIYISVGKLLKYVSKLVRGSIFHL